jgi:hypothetical protein
MNARIFNIKEQSKDQQKNKQYFVKMITDYNDEYDAPCRRLDITQEEYEALKDVDVFIKSPQKEKSGRVGAFYGADIFIKD